MIQGLSISPETAFLVHCARDCDNHEVPEEIDWQQVIALAENHRVIPSLHNQLAKKDFPLIPGKYEERIKNMFIANCARCAFLTKQMLKVLDILESKDIKAVPHKGPLLSQQIYGNTDSRQYDDIDLLVDPGELPHALEVFKENGFRPDLALSERQAEYFNRSRFDWILRKGETRVDLNSAVMPRYFSFKLEFRDVLSGAEPVEIMNRKIYAMNRQDTFIALCVHGAFHSWDRLGWLIDLNQLINGKQDIDWKAVAARAAETGSLRMVSLGVLLAESVLETRIPDELKSIAKEDRIAKRLAEAATGHLLREDNNGGRNRRAEFFFHFRMRERLADRLKYALRYLADPTYSDWLMADLPPALYFLYYPLRLIRLLFRQKTSPARQDIGPQEH